MKDCAGAKLSLQALLLFARSGEVVDQSYNVSFYIDHFRHENMNWLEGEDAYCDRANVCCTGAGHRLLAFHQILAFAVSMADQRTCLDNNWRCDRNVVGNCECAIKLSRRGSGSFCLGDIYQFFSNSFLSSSRRQATDLRSRTATSRGIDQKPSSETEYGPLRRNKRYLGNGPSCAKPG